MKPAGDGHGPTDLRCERLRRAAVDDALRLEALQAHARECTACAEFLADEARLRAEVEAWRADTPAPPAELRTRVLDAVADRRSRATPPRRARTARWIAAAALLLLAVAAAAILPEGLRTRVVSVGGGLLVDDALAEARRAERAHAEAIARLAAAAAPILARADSTDLPPRELARLLAWRDRLAAADDAIRQVEQFLESNPGHPSARTMLLAAYIDKTDLLGEILASYPVEEA